MSRPISPPTADRTLWQRFEIGASLVPPLALLWIASRKGWIPPGGPWSLIAMPTAVVIGLRFPAAFAGGHRGLSRVQSWIGKRLLAALLGLAFVVAVLPMGLWLRARGRSFLEPPPGDSYWTTPRPPGSLKNQF